MVVSDRIVNLIRNFLVNHHCSGYLVIIWIVNFISWLTFLWVVIKNENEIFYKFNIVGYIVDAAELVCPYTTHFVLLIETILKLPIRTQLFNSLNELDDLTQLLMQNETECWKKQLRNRLLYRWLIFFVPTVVTEVIIMTNITGSWLLKWLLMYFVLVATRFGIFYYVYLVTSISFRLELMIHRFNGNRYPKQLLLDDL